MASAIGGTDDMCVWNSDVPYYHTPNYTLPTVQSINRISIGLGLILTHEIGITFKSAQGYGSFVHMLATATAALVFSQTNLNLSMWAGFNTSRDDVDATRTQQGAILIAINDIARYTNVQNLVNSWQQWDQDVIFEYFGMDPFNDTNWLSYSPVPHFLMQQWSKINFETGEAPKEVT